MKQIFIKTYQAGVIKGTFFEFVVSEFQSSLNSGLGDLTVTIPRKFDSYNSDGALTLGNELRVYISDREAPQGVLVYSGEINSIVSSLSSIENVEVYCSGYLFQLALSIYYSSTFQIYNRFTATDPSTMIEDIIDQYQTNNTNYKITYTAGSIASTGKSLGLVTFLSTGLNAIKQAVDLADYDWFWRVGADNIFYFDSIPATATHLFTMGRDIASMSVDYSIRDLRNNLVFTNGLAVNDPEVIQSLYTDNTSGTTYGSRVEFKRDDRYKASTGSVAEYASKFLNTYKDPLSTLVLRIIDSNLGGGYDIESIKVGDTCKILNVENIASLTDNMIITNINYAIDYIDITIIDAQKYIQRVVQETSKTIAEYAFSDNMPLTLS